MMQKSKNFDKVSILADLSILHAITIFLDQVRKRLSSQLIKGISRVLQKVLTYFNGSIISTFFAPLASVSPVIFYLYLNDLLLRLAAVQSTIVSALFKDGSSL